MNSIAYLIVGLGTGGAEAQVVEVSKRVAVKGWKPRVITLLSAEGHLADQLDGAGVPVISLGMRRGVPDPRSVLRLAAILRKEHVAILHSHMFHANILGRIGRKVAGVPVCISTVHTSNSNWHRDLAYRATDKLADLTTLVSVATRDRYRMSQAVPPDRSCVVPNGVDTIRFCRREQLRSALRRAFGVENRFVWLAVGRHEAPKDYKTMLQAFAQLQDRNAMLLIAGTGALLHEAQRSIIERGLSRDVRLLGLRTDIAELMNASDAYVLSSRWEGMPMVLLEAGASELPAVATCVGGNAEVIRHGSTGFLVPPADPDALASSMRKVMDITEPARLAIGRNARLHVLEHFSIDSVVQRWESLYCEMLSAKTSGVRLPSAHPER